MEPSFLGTIEHAFPENGTLFQYCDALFLTFATDTPATFSSDFVFPFAKCCTWYALTVFFLVSILLALRSHCFLSKEFSLLQRF